MVLSEASTSTTTLTGQIGKLMNSIVSFALAEFLQQFCPNVAAKEFSEGALGSSGSVMCRRVSRFRPCVWAHPVSTPQQPRCFHQVRNQQVRQLTNSWDINSERSARLMPGRHFCRAACWEPTTYFFQSWDWLLQHGSGCEPPVSLLQSLGSRVQPPAGTAAVQLRWFQPHPSQTLPLQGSPSWTGCAVPWLPLKPMVLTKLRK